MIETVIKLGFVTYESIYAVGYKKRYNGFDLCVFNLKIDPKCDWFASIGINGKEVSIPSTIDAKWLIEFDEDNND